MTDNEQPPIETGTIRFGSPDLTFQRLNLNTAIEMTKSSRGMELLALQEVREDYFDEPDLLHEQLAMRGWTDG